MPVTTAAKGEVAFLSASASAAEAAVGEDVGAVVVDAAAAVEAVGEEEGGAEKNEVMLFCFCFLPVEAGRAPGNLRLRGADILGLLIVSYSLN